MRDWGLLPQQVIDRLRTREWDQGHHLRQRLLGERGFPLRLPLKPPTGTQALENIDHLHGYRRAWRDWPQGHYVLWSTRAYRQLGRLEVPEALEIPSMQALIECLGEQAVARSRAWADRMAPLLALDRDLYPVLVQHLFTLERLQVFEAERLARVLEQLRPAMGRGGYLRALPLRGVDTKFLEQQASLVAALLDRLTQGELARAGGLLSWLDCREVPRNWLLLRPLDRRTRQALAGLRLLRLPAEQLRETPLPARRVLVVENQETGFALPDLPDTVAVFGGGLNVAWLNAPWLTSKAVAYWGDLDSWGFDCLARARQLCPKLRALLMDRETVSLHRPLMVREERSQEVLPEGLTDEEAALWQELRQGVHGGTRLEQERLAADHIADRLWDWVKSTDP
ncbi:MAG: DUF3322 domain-containing protein [Candidatus Competibacteraceae bacterium]|nr:DUF3322 domain-containing protein [Candidatus Competibacteraceae bacterium]